MIPAYIEAICKEIARVARSHPEADSAGLIPAHTVFFGGGTPSLLSVDQIERILAALRAHFALPEGSEITLEANPGTVSLDYLQGLRRLGVNRLSFGMQSAHPDDLRLLERQHDFFDVVQAVRWARQAGFDNLSVDLIFGLPGQSLERWQATVQRAVDMETDHLSLYALTIEHGTPLYRRWARGMIPLVNEDLAADMYEWTMETLPQSGFEQYEISNFARHGKDGALLASQHNLQYWHNLPYLGFGPGAHGFACGQRTMNVGGIRPYIERCENDQPGTAGDVFPCGPAARRAVQVSQNDEMQETMMVGLRLTQEGVAEKKFQERFNQPLLEIFGKEIDHLSTLGLLEWTGPQDDRRLRLTQRGRMLGNQVFMRFVGS